MLDVTGTIGRQRISPKHRTSPNQARTAQLKCRHITWSSLQLPGALCGLDLCFTPRLFAAAPPPPQANIYSPDRTFYSFKQVVRELNSSCLLVSLHSTSKVSSTSQQQSMAAPCQAGPFCHEAGTLVSPWTMGSALL